ncbi:MAG TPA: zinc ribbon domain-containing protein [Lysobacter sp.]
MPIYAFECAACGHRFDRLQKLSDADPAQCPACGEPQVRRQLTAPQFRLAGGGWYETDFKKDGDKKRNLAGEGRSSEGGSSEGGGGKATESKPAGSKPADSKPAESKPAEKKAEPTGKPAA